MTLLRDATINVHECAATEFQILILFITNDPPEYLLSEIKSKQC